VSLGPVKAVAKKWHGHDYWGGCKSHKDHLLVTLPLHNYTTNPISAGALKGIWAHLRDKTPGVEIEGFPGRWYGTLAPGETREQTFVLGLDTRRFQAGTPIELVLEVTGECRGKSRTTLPYTLFTDAPEATTLVAENFDILPAGSALPVGWRSAHGGGTNTVPWTSSSTFCGTGSRGAFHANAEDGVGGDATRWERLLSPAFLVPADSDYVTVEFDACYNTEDNLPFPVWAWDGFFLRVTDLTPGRVVISNLVEAFADQFTTGSFDHYPKHLPRNSDPRYFEDMSVWAGDSGGVQHVRMRLPGMQGSTAQLRFEYTQDSVGTCADPAATGGVCGVFIDNVVVKSHTAR
jgi:hypothetical protein